ncbi:hypothetical protein TNCV_4176381 [Trichonephila clavipes]|nr:hypothetical protein TNCV_4176381 [Trichonephila clavipes]
MEKSDEQSPRPCMKDIQERFPPATNVCVQDDIIVGIVVIYSAIPVQTIPCHSLHLQSQSESVILAIRFFFRGIQLRQAILDGWTNSSLLDY